MLKLHELVLDNVAGVDHAELSFPETGVVVVHGPNEVGKSTFLSAFELLLSDVGVNSRSKSVRALRQRGKDEDTAIAALMTVGDKKLHIRKVFRPGSGKAELRVERPRPESLTGRQAEDRFAEILAEGVDESLLAALTVHQGSSLGEFRAGDVQSLPAMLHSTSDGEEEPDGHRPPAAWEDADTSALLARAEGEYLRYYTAKGKISAKGPLAAAQKASEVAQEDLAQVREDYDQARELIRHIEDGLAEQVEVRRGLPTAREELAAAEQKLAQVNKAQERLAAQQQRVDSARSAAQLAHMKVDERAAAAQRVREARAAVDSGSQDHSRLQAEAHAEAEALTAAKAALSALTEEHRAAKQLVATLTQAGAAERAAAERERTAAKLERARGVNARLDGAAEKLRTNVATPQRVAALRDALAELNTAQQVLEASSTSVEIHGPAGAVFTEDGEEHTLGSTGTPFTTKATQRREYGLGDFQVVLTPSQELHEPEQAVRRAQEAVEAASRQLHVEPGDLPAARKQNEEREALERNVAELRLELATITSGTPIDELERRLHDAQAESERAQAARDAESERWSQLVPDPGSVNFQQLPAGLNLADLHSDSPADPERGEHEAAAAELARAWEQACDSGLADLRARLEATATGASFRLQAAEQAFTEKRATADAAVRALSEQRELRSDEELSKAAAEAASHLQGAEAALAEQREECGRLDPTSAQAEVDGAKVRLQRLEARKRDLETAITRAEGALGTRAGVAERLADAERAATTAQRDLDRVERAAAAASLLWETLNRARAELRAAYEEPFKRRFQELARVVFGPDSEFVLGEDLGIEARVQQGLRLDTELLSGGAQEQLLLLARLAVATLAGREGSVPIFLDDALGFSDPRRIRAMNTVLGQLGKQHQIVVFTCDVNRFDRISGAQFTQLGSAR
ncbi:ATP-binding protein [Corynebacterium heidelbergense]|uniref:Rad50/SbcC-type AAA domain-containing protein n=1 Tax=Corynebacterium heidelbergense TaxID=2055947 RepID=A0A364V7P3_9CORY|nr:AAA family ATPase [Corynebacterium heidelbergense]RAV32683.1 hypothetical protein DLJ54_02150 [Corynebacterium heidelbergense]